MTSRLDAALLADPVARLVDLGLAGRLHPALRSLARLSAAAAAGGPGELDRLGAAVSDAIGRRAGRDPRRAGHLGALVRHQLRASERAVAAAALAEAARAQGGTIARVDGRGGVRVVALRRHLPPPRSQRAGAAAAATGIGE